MDAGDGVRLLSRIWRPAGAGPWPVLLMRQPYGRAIASTVTYAHPSWYAAQGFLVVVQDVRGRGGSEGEFHGWSQEAADGAAAVRWARRLPGSNGRLGTYGFSYQGLCQLLNDSKLSNAEQSNTETSLDRQALPDCLAPAMAGLDERLHWATEGGAHWWALGLGWALQLAAEGCRRRGDDHGWRSIRQALTEGRWLEEGLELLATHDPAGMGHRWLQQDPHQPSAWRRHQPPTALLQRPMLLIGGWHDPHLRGVLDLWWRSRAAGGSPLLRIGAWSHLNWQGGVDALQLAFFRRHLGGPAGGPASGSATGVEQNPAVPVAVQCVLEGLWYAARTPEEQTPQGQTPPDQQPSPRQQTLSWSLHSSGLAAIRSDEGELRSGDGHGSGRVTVVHDPWRPVPGRGGHLGLEAGLVLRDDLDQRADVACFTTAPLHGSLLLLGTPVLRLRLEADQPAADLCVALSRIEADGGRVQQLCCGVRRLRRLQGARRVAVALQPLAAQLQGGDRLRLSIAGAAWPQVAVNPGDGSLPRGGSSRTARVISLELELTEGRLQLRPLPGLAQLGQTEPA